MAVGRTSAKELALEGTKESNVMVIIAFHMPTEKKEHEKRDGLPRTPVDFVLL